MCILNGIQIWTRNIILHIFQGNPRELTLYIYMHLIGATIECVNMYYEMHMTKDS
jgi:hypothetical protein